MTQMPENIPGTLTELRGRSVHELPSCCAQYRNFLISEILEHGGHFSANLGTVELTVALHYVLNTPHDQLVWDVGHQAYLHKILTGRKDAFHTIRKLGGLSGFPKQEESVFDVFGTGHSSTSISAVLGLAEADKILGVDRQHVAVIGDGSLTGGMAWEALNNASVTDSNVLIIINDNQMGIDPNAGGLNQYLDGLGDQANFFSQLGFEYRHTEDGHNVEQLVETLSELVTIPQPRIWHIKTVKGKGYLPAEDEQTKWHAVKYVKITEGDENRKGPKFQDVFGETLLELAQHNKRIVGITPAMPSGCGMRTLMDQLPDQCFDVGIAEQHAVTFSAGLATNGLTPFCNIYSTFLQRAYDQVIHDVCLQNLHVILCLDRAGVVGEDGSTHHGLYDLAFLRCLPNLTLMAPSNEIELRNMMYSAVDMNGPIAIRYPKGRGIELNWKKDFERVEYGKIRSHLPGSSGMLLNAGALHGRALEVRERLLEHDIQLGVADVGFVKPLDTEFLDSVFSEHQVIFTLEDGCKTGGFGSAVLEYANEKGYTGDIILLGFPDKVIDHGTRDELLQEFALDVDSLTETVFNFIRKG